MKIRTVEINRDGRKVLINKSDFDPDKHTPWGVERSEWDRERAEVAKQRPKEPETPVEPSEGDSDEPEAPDEWESLAERLVQAGYKQPHPNTKLETLRRKVSEL